MEAKYLHYTFLSVKIIASCLWIWFAGIHLWIQQTKHLQCTLGQLCSGGYHSHKSDVFAEVPNCRGKLARFMHQTFCLSLIWYKNKFLLQMKFHTAGKKSCNLR